MTEKRRRSFINKEKGCFIIAEAAQVHDGSLGVAYSFIDAAADCGTDAVKFQTHIAGAESTLDEPWRVKFSRQDVLRYDYWKRMEFTNEQWYDLAAYAKKKKIMFLSSPFSIDAVNILNEIGVPIWKIASGEIHNTELLKRVWKTRKPILFSTGMCALKELDAVVRETRSRNIPFGIFQCTSEYPCLPQHWGLNMIYEFRKRYNCPVGFSDHSGEIYAGLAAAAMGADFIEVHAAFSKKISGPDITSSVTFEDLSKLVEGIKRINLSFRNPVDKNVISTGVKNLRNIFGRSWALKNDLQGGTVVEREYLTLKKPGSGIPQSKLHMIIGKKLKHDKSAKRLLTFADFR